MRIYLEQKSIDLNLTPNEAVVLAEYLDGVETTKAQRGTLNPVKLASNLRLFASWLTDGICHD